MPSLLLLAAKAQTFERDVAAAQKGGNASTHEILLALTVALGVGVALFLATFLYFRRKKRRELSRRQSSSPPKPSTTVEIDPETGEERRRRRKRRRRRSHRQRNPTLDKTGGLPPPRPDHELPSF